MHRPPNIVLIITDQQRADSINALGAPWMRTPHFDRLVREGTAFTNCFATSPVCVSSRASLFCGVYPHTTNVYTNFERWQPNWVDWLADAGYHRVNIGKMHINPYDAKGGFHQRFMAENKDRPLFLDEHERAIYDEWDKALKARGLRKPSRYTRAEDDPEDYLRTLGCFTWEVDDDMHPDNFVGNTAKWWLQERQADVPFFLQIGFPGPHPPYDPTAEHLAAYRDVDIPFERASPSEIAGQPSMHRALRQSMIDFNIDSVAWREDVGELYDLVADPGETRNLWHDTAHRDYRDRAVMEVLAWMALGAFRANRPKTPKPQAPMTIENKSRKNQGAKS